MKIKLLIGLVAALLYSGTVLGNTKSSGLPLFGADHSSEQVFRGGNWSIGDWISRWLSRLADWRDNQGSRDNQGVGDQGVGDQGSWSESGSRATAVPELDGSMALLAFGLSLAVVGVFRERRRR